MCVLVTQSCPTLDPMDCSPPDSSVHEILWTRILEWLALPFSRGSSWPRDWTWVSCIAGGCFTVWATREAQCFLRSVLNSYLVLTMWQTICQCKPQDHSRSKGRIRASTLDFMKSVFFFLKSFKNINHIDHLFVVNLPLYFRDWLRVSHIEGEFFIFLNFLFLLYFAL